LTPTGIIRERILVFLIESGVRLLEIHFRKTKIIFFLFQRNYFFFFFSLGIEKVDTTDTKQKQTEKSLTPRLTPTGKA